MSSPSSALSSARRRLSACARGARRWGRADAPALVRRFAGFWIVWSALLFVHEWGHAASARREGLAVRRVSVGVGPILWRGRQGDTQVVLRLLPVAGMTTTRTAGAARADRGRWGNWLQQARTLAGGVLATLAVAVAAALVAAVRERRTGRRCVWGRILVADAVVLTIFNFLPVPPLDGGRAVLGAVSAWRGAPLEGAALLWLQVGGLALAVVPMAVWTRWTARIDAAALWWGAPARDG